MYRVLPVPSVRIKQRIESILLRLLSPWYLHSRNNCTKQDSKYIFIVFLICGGVQLSIHWYKSPNSSAQPSTLFSLDTRPRLLSFLHLDRFNDPLECVCDASGSQSAGGQKIGGTSRRDFLHVKQCPKRIYVMRQRHITLICDD